MRKNLFFLLFLFSISVSFAQTSLTEAVDFTVTDVEGHEHHLFDYLDNGKYVLIDFFFTTCGPCQQTAPKVSEAYEYFGCNSADLIVLGIDNGDSDAQVIAFDESYGSTYPSVSGIEGGGTAVCSAYGISLYPCVILIAPDRQIVNQDIWPIPSAQTIIDVVVPYGPQEADCDGNQPEIAEDFTVTDIEGVEHNLYDYLNNDKHVLLNFFETTDEESQETAPKVNEAYQYFGCNSADLVVIGVNHGTNNADVGAFNDTYGCEYPSVSGTEGGGDSLCSSYAINSFPTVMLIAPNKEIINSNITPIETGQTLIDSISPYGPQEAECGVGIYENLNNIDIYPVPANDFVKIANAQGYYLSVYNTNGQIVLQKNIISNTEAINLEKLCTGIYMLKFSNELDAKKFTISVVK